METLDFKGPFHWSHLKHLSSVTNSGIYIWGFMFDFDKISNKLTNHVDFNLDDNIKMLESQIISANNGFNYNGIWKYIPYYVGRDSSLFARMIAHHSVDNVGKAGNKYTRLSKEAYKTFFLGNQFPVLTGNKRIPKWNAISNYIDSYTKDHKHIPIEYFNSDFILEKLYDQTIEIIPENSGNDWPYYLQKNQYGTRLFSKSAKFNYDTLEKMIIQDKNFWFCYAELPDRIKATNDMESQTYYSLKGITISETLEYERNKNKFNHKITPNSTCKSIFSLDASNLHAVHHDKMGFTEY